MTTDDTIAAISSIPAPSARIIIRLSGPMSHAIASELSGVQAFAPGSAQRKMLAIPTQTPVSEVLRRAGSDGDQSGSSEYLRDRRLNVEWPAWIYAFRAPHSYTGEDLIEFHIPGSPVLAKMLLDELYRRGARQAEPGEFTARAFFNGKLGLTEAEGVAATISAGNEAELTAARQLLAGELARRLQPITDPLAQTLALIEVGIDFTEEDVTFLASDEVARLITEANSALADLLDQSVRFEQLTHEPRIVFAGRPNAGKSSLINALTRQSRAIVSDVAGTTRDVLTATLDLPRGQVILADVAGLETSAQGDIDQAMQLHAKNAVESADHVILVHDCTDDRPMLEPGRQIDLVVLTKSDLTNRTPDKHPGLRVSSKTSFGMTDLIAALDSIAFGTERTGATISLNRRHLSAITTAREALTRAQARVIENAPELVAMDLRDALDSLGSIVGQITRDDVLGRIFSAFCIGK